MDFLFDLLIGWLWWGRDGRTKAADIGDSYVMPVLMVICVGCLIALLAYVLTR